MANQAKATIYWEGQAMHLPQNPTITENNPAETELVRGMSPTDEPVLWRVGQRPDYTITFDCPIKSDPEQPIDWADLADRRAEGRFQLEIQGTGKVYSYEARVISCGTTVDESRNVTWNVTIRAANRKPIG